MNKIACQYAIVRFAPFIETGEFANVGIVMIAPKLHFFGFQLETKRYARITRFFDDIDANVYKKTLHNFKAEMDRINNTFQQETNNPSFINNIFNEITRTRETIIRFSKVRTVLTDNPKKQLNKLFAYYVERNFVTKQYQEALLEKDVRNLLCEADIEKHFSREKIGDDAYNVVFPFVDKRADTEKVIKPLHLGHDDSTQIYNHGAAWVFKINQLKNKHYLQPENVLFTLSTPQINSGNRFDAYQEIKDNLIDTGAKVLAFNQDNEHILEFAQAK